MRRIIIIGAALCAVAGAATAMAASHANNYTGSKLVIAPAVSKGSLGMTEILKATGTKPNRAAPLTNIKVVIYGVKLDVGKLPVCTDALIEKNKTNPDGGCSPNSLIANGAVKALLGQGSDPTAAGTPCNPYLHVFNGGPKTQVFYFYTKSATDCAGLTTGATAPYDGHITYSGGNAIINVPLPADISTKVANQPGLYSSLIAESLVYPKKVGGKVYMTSVACKGKNRPWSISFTAQTYSGGKESQTIKGSSKC